MYGPAPTGLVPKLAAPCFASAVGSTIIPARSASPHGSCALGWEVSSCTSVSLTAWMELGITYSSASTMSPDAMYRFQSETTAAALSGVPSENLSPGRSQTVKMSFFLAPVPLKAHLVAMPGISVPFASISIRLPKMGSR